MRPSFFIKGRQVFYTLALSFSILISSLGAMPIDAIAAPNQPQLMALFGSNRAEQLDDMAKTDIDKTFGSGTSKQAEGVVKQAQGKAQRDIQKTGSSLKEAQGKAKQDIGRTQSAVGDLENSAESAAEDAKDTVKGLFN
ncbi:CsbD family protein [Acaryochloris sp. CCMEE 5410]|uniref:CsbD family protein n=1 Tax=Acaryochloris sp. CCMEE 5410 TaxID=310037 RepID=UPI0006808474|nr:CsbD family protein [Acaryochloris sp. CCMEE 5410]KAI9132255.1 CsbD family protein [Acaryochloris sp. CCMEE 5410]